MTERERLIVEARYYGLDAPGHDRPRAIAALQALLAKYPTDPAGLTSLAREYESRGDFSPADSLLRRAAAVDPTNVITQMNRIILDVGAGRFADASDVIRSAREVGSPVASAQEWMIYWADGQIDSTASVLKTGQRSSNDFIRHRALLFGSLLASTRGRLRESSRVTAELAAVDSARGAEGRPLFDAVNAAQNDALFLGKNVQAVQKLDAALARYPARLQGVPSLFTADPIDASVAIAYARAGRPDRARAVVAQWYATGPDSVHRQWMEPFRHEVVGEIALAEAKPRAAVDEFRLSARRPDGEVEWCHDCREAQIGIAFDRAGMPDSAIVAFERYVAMTSYVKLGYDAAFLAGTYKRLGELYEQQRNIPKAIAYTKKFIELWKDSDPELQPRVAEARQRLARLTKHEAR